MEKVKNLEDTAWISVDSSYKTKRYDEPRKKVRNIYWIKIEDTGKRYITNYSENEYKFYKYEIFYKSLKPAYIEMNGWMIKKIEDPPKVKHAYEGATAIYTDPNGELRTVMIYDADGALEQLKKISEYSCWENFDLQTKNDKLSEENDAIKVELSDLRQKIECFENTSLFESLIEEYNSLKNKELSKFLKKFNIDKSFIEKWLK